MDCFYWSMGQAASIYVCHASLTAHYMHLGCCMMPWTVLYASYSLCCLSVNGSLHMSTAFTNHCSTHHKRPTLTHALSSTSCVLHRLPAFSPRPQVLLFPRRLIAKTKSTRKQWICLAV
jgi:hypothetical protein